MKAICSKCVVDLHDNRHLHIILNQADFVVRDTYECHYSWCTQRWYSHFAFLLNLFLPALIAYTGTEAKVKLSLRVRGISLMR